MNFIIRLDKAEKIKIFLNEHPLINIRGLEKESEIPLDTIRKFMEGTKGLPSKHFEKIENVLIKYGYQKEES